jgi:DDB1- and CUL4-associated factor 13
LLTTGARARRCLRRLVGHTREVKGIAVAPDGETAVSCSADCTVKVWRVPPAPLERGAVQQDATAEVELVGQHAFLGIDYHHQRDVFATCGHAVDVWDAEHSEPVQTFTWDSESVYSVRFNPVCV